MSGGSVLGLQTAVVQARHQDPQVTVLPRLMTVTGGIARFQAVAFVYWILHLQVWDHVPLIGLVYGFEWRPSPCYPDLRRMGQGAGYCRNVARSEVELLL